MYLDAKKRNLEVSENNNLWLVYVKAKMPVEHKCNMGGTEAVYASVVMPAKSSDEALSYAKSALMEKELELLDVKHCEVFDPQKEYSHDSEVVNDIRKTAMLARDEQQLKVGGYIDPEIEEKDE